MQVAEPGSGIRASAAEAMLKDYEDRRGVIVEDVKTKAQGFLPHRDG